jgi:uncharacterized protein YigE (DUF2233 family)
MKLKTLFVCPILLSVLFPSYLTGSWEKIGKGLFWGQFDAPKEYLVGNEVRLHMKKYKIKVLKIDPNYYRLKLLSSSQYNSSPLTVKKWCQKYNLIAGINASMYGKDHLTSTGYMINTNHINNSKINPKFGGFIVFNPKISNLPSVQIIDRYFHDWQTMIKKYDTVIQNYRMISINQANVWSKGEKFYSNAALGIDTEGNVLFILGRLPYSTHDFIDILLRLPIKIYNAVYLEGGPEASLYLRFGDIEKQIMGSYETDFSYTDNNVQFWAVPNIIGIVEK